MCLHLCVRGDTAESLKKKKTKEDEEDEAELVRGPRVSTDRTSQQVRGSESADLCPFTSAAVSHVFALMGGC